MPQRSVTSGRSLVLVTISIGALSLFGCSSGGSSTPLGGTAGDNGGSAGSSTGASAGDTGAAGASTAGSAGSQGGGSAGASTTGSAGASITGSAGAGAAGMSGGGGAGGASVTSPDGGTMTGSAGASGGRPSGPSAACGKDAPTDAIGKAVRHDLVVANLAAEYVPAYVNRYYYTTLPTGFDPTKQYPVVFYGQGCGQTGSEGSSWTSGHFLTDIFYVQLIPATVTGATVVPSDGSPGCFQAGKQGGADSPDGPYFDQVLAQIEQTYCIDTGKMYVSGSSSGAWLSNYLACARGNVLRGATADSGGLQQAHGTCTGGAAIMEMPGDSTSSIVTINNMMYDIGVGPARDTFIAANGCSTTPTATMSFGAANGCMVYGNCSSPVVWCNVGGAHQSGQSYIADSSWAFWMTLQ